MLQNVQQAKRKHVVAMMVHTPSHTGEETISTLELYNSASKEQANTELDVNLKTY
jgi:hypothetical protein